MAGPKCYKSEKQKKIIELLKNYLELLLTLKQSIWEGQVEVAEEKMSSMELLMLDLHSSVKNCTDEIFITDIQLLLLKIKELQQQIYDYNFFQVKKLKAKKPHNIVKKYYYSY